MRELIVDSFAGGGGASTGIELALGISPDIAINHDAVALNMHAANHPATKHLPHSIWKVDPLQVCEGRQVGLLWASPDCKHFSKAKGGKPVERSIRDLAWVVVRWAKQVSPRVIILENVEEFQTWGPLGDDGRPCPLRKGATFKRWISELRKLGYKVDWRELRACDYGAPTIRKRLFLIARRDGLPIVWPKPTHGDPASDAVLNGKLKPWRTAAEIIDWSLPCPSIFDSSAEIMEKYGLRAVRPLQPATLARIAKGVKRYVLESAKPFIVPITHVGDTRIKRPGGSAPIGIVSPTLIQTGYGEREGQEPRVPGLDKPLGTAVACGVKHALVAAFLAQHNVENGGGVKAGRPLDVPVSTILQSGSHQTLTTAFMAQHNYLEPGHDAREPVSTIVAKGSTQAVVSAGLTIMKGSDRRGRSVEAPSPAVLAEGTHIAETRAFLQKYYGVDQDPRLEEPLHTATTKGRFGLVTVMVEGEPYIISDIGMRMLTPRELFRAQGFPESYIIDRGADGKPITKTDQVSKCGNSVCPDVAKALVAANFSPLEVAEREQDREFFLEAAE